MTLRSSISIHINFIRNLYIYYCMISWKLVFLSLPFSRLAQAIFINLANIFHDYFHIVSRYLEFLIEGMVYPICVTSVIMLYIFRRPSNKVYMLVS